MISVDTNVWIGFLHGKPATRSLSDRLTGLEVLVHPFVIGELVLGSLGRKREDLLADLSRLRRARECRHDEVMDFIHAHRLANAGIGYVDAHLLCSAHTDGNRLWSLDGAVMAAAQRLGVGYKDA